MSNFDLIKADAAGSLMPTYARFDAAIERGEGAKLWDADGREYIDFTSGIGVNCLGYGDPDWVKAVCAQAGTLAHISNLYYNSVQVRLAKGLCERTGFARVFFANSGAEANEGIIKLARKYSFDKYGRGRDVIVTLQNSFHGRTVTTLSATGQEHFHQSFFPFTPGFRFTPANDAGALAEACGKDTCAILLEGVQGEGGVLPLDPSFVSAAAELAKQRDILLLFDEVQTGIGRTGKFFSYEHFGITPDAISTAKGIAGGLPMGAVLCNEKLKDVLGPGSHAATFGGNPVAAAGALVVLQKVGDETFLQGVAEKGAYLREKLAALPKVKNIRGLGLMLAFDIEGVDSKAAAGELLRRGLLILTAKTSLRMLPPLVITKDEIDKGLTVLEQYMKEASA